MIKCFKNTATRDIAAGSGSASARRLLPVALHPAAQRKLALLNRVKRLDDLVNLPGSRLEKLSGSRAGQYSIRINIQYRICFVWDGQDADKVEIVDYH